MSANGIGVLLSGRIKGTLLIEDDVDVVRRRGNHLPKTFVRLLSVDVTGRVAEGMLYILGGSSNKGGASEGEVRGLQVQ